jgi:hypothetical protein
MYTTRSLFSLAAVTAVSLIATREARADYCKLNNSSYIMGDVTSASGDSSWTNSSVRYPGKFLSAATASKGSYTSGVKTVSVNANQSDVAAYMYSSDTFSGSLKTLACKKGNTCTWTFGSNIPMHSLVCQREFGRKGDASTLKKVENPVIETSLFIPKIEEATYNMLMASGDVNGVSGLAARVEWVTGETVDPEWGFAQTAKSKYNDSMRTYVKFVLDIDNWGFDYNVHYSFFDRPVLDKGSLSFSHLGTKLWVEGGLISGKVFDGIWGPLKTAGQNVPTMLLDGIKAEIKKLAPAGLGDLAVDQVLNNKTRLQMARVTASSSNAVVFKDSGGTVFSASNSDLVSPAIVLNKTRTADY